MFGKKENPYKEITVGMSDLEILKIVGMWAQRGEKFRKVLETEGTRNYGYFVGVYPRDLQTIEVGKSNAVDNRIFSAIKSVTPFVTSRPAQPVCYSKKDSEDKEKTEESKFVSNCTQDILKKIYLDTQVQKLNEQNSANRYIYKIGLLRYGLKDGKLFTRVVNPKDVIFDEGAKQFKDSVFLGEPVEYTAERLIALYPKKEKEILAHISGKQSTRIKCIEWWTEKVTCVTIENKVVLTVQKNKLFNENTENLNYYNCAPIPYVALNVYNLGDTLLDNVSEIDLTYLLQDSVNDITRATIDNVKFCGNPIKLGVGFSEQQLSIVGSATPGDSIIMGKDQDLRYLQAQGMPAFVENTLASLKNEIDAVFGTQATFRGEFEGVQSGVSRQILREAAGDSLSQISRGIERMMDDLYRGWLHVIMVYLDDPEFVKAQIAPILGDRTEKYVQYIFNDDDGIEVSVRPGSILPEDPITKSEQAMELAKMGRITNELLYETLGIANPDEEAEKLDLNETTIAIQAQELQARADEAAQERTMMRGEADSINAEIDALDAGGEQTAPEGPPAGAAPVNISIGGQPEVPPEPTIP